MNKVFKANNTTAPCRTKKKEEMPNCITFPHNAPELPVLQFGKILSLPTLSDQTVNSQHLTPSSIFSPTSLPKCCSISMLSVRGTLFFLILAWPRFRMSSRTDFRLGCLYRNKNQTKRDTMQREAPSHFLVQRWGTNQVMSRTMRKVLDIKLIKF